jgi:hypothetical protein
MEKGWPAFLAVLRLYLAHFRGQRAASVQAMGGTSLAEAEAHAEMMNGLGFPAALPPVGTRVATRPGVPPLAGVIEGKVGMLLAMRMEQPAPGVALFGAADCGPHGVMVQLNAYFYGDGAAAVAERQGPAWQAWFNERFPMNMPMNDGEVAS